MRLVIADQLIIVVLWTSIYFLGDYAFSYIKSTDKKYEPLGSYIQLLRLYILKFGEFVVYNKSY